MRASCGAQMGFGSVRLQPDPTMGAVRLKADTTTKAHGRLLRYLEMRLCTE